VGVGHDQPGPDDDAGPPAEPRPPAARPEPSTGPEPGREPAAPSELSGEAAAVPGPERPAPELADGFGVVLAAPAPASAPTAATATSAPAAAPASAGPAVTPDPDDGGGHPGGDVGHRLLQFFDERHLLAS
jgi:hypothetical protein